MRLFVFGLGYSATAIARRIRDAGGAVAGTVRVADKAAALRGEGIDAVAFDGTAPVAAVALDAATHILASVPPGAAGDPVLAHFGAAIAAAPRLAWLGYLSTVGVYGDRGGAWVDEETPPRPAPGRSAARRAAELAWEGAAAARGVPLGVFRLAGIYGPGRSALVNLAEGRARRVVKPGQVFNRIHVEDVAAVVAAAVARPAARIYNLADDEPAPPEEVVAYAAGLMGVPPPPAVALEAAGLPPMARSFYAENKRVANRRIKEELGVRLAYPSYREGLSAMWVRGDWR